MPTPETGFMDEFLKGIDEELLHDHGGGEKALDIDDFQEYRQDSTECILNFYGEPEVEKPNIKEKRTATKDTSIEDELEIEKNLSKAETANKDICEIARALKLRMLEIDVDGTTTIMENGGWSLMTVTVGSDASETVSHRDDFMHISTISFEGSSWA